MLEAADISKILRKLSMAKLLSNDLNVSALPKLVNFDLLSHSVHFFYSTKPVDKGMIKLGKGSS